MKTVILCGGRGTRLGGHGETMPKALIEIGGRPILWHLLKIYAHYRLNDFILCLGHLGENIKSYFQPRYIGVGADNKFDLGDGQFCKIEFVDTGLDTNTGGRVKLIEKHIDEETFCVTYGDGLSDINISSLIDFHTSHGKLATLTAVHPQSNFGMIKVDDASGAVVEFQEKPRLKEWINGGFFVFDRKVFDYIDDNAVLEREPLEKLAGERQLIAYKHRGFWKCMDTLKDNMEFNEIWKSSADWKIWP
ncbi:MAG: sugar phosphate nucleotidyltransferase [Pyrinomonadaceae bacterium]